MREYRAWIELDINNLYHNIDVMTGMLPPKCQLMPAVKANAYGHGAVPVAKALQKHGIENYCVASASEGVKLRSHGIHGNILVLGYTEPESFSLLSLYNLTQTVVDYEYACLLNSLGRKLPVHIAVDTGMHRLGIPVNDTGHIHDVFEMKNLTVTGIYTHLCTADGESQSEQEYVGLQAERFNRIMDEIYENGYNPKTHILSSYGLLNYGELGGDYVRAGIALYGFGNSELRPVLSLKARVASVRNLKKGESAGYGMAYTAKNDTAIAALSIGYADGIPRSLSCGVGRVLINGQALPIIGKICMDQILVETGKVADIKPGDTAVLIGKSGDNEITATEMADAAETIPNEILSRLGSRLTRVLTCAYSNKYINTPKLTSIA